MAYTSIFEAAANNDLTAVKEFIEDHRIRPDTQNSFDDTVAHIAAQNDNIEMLEYLLKKDRDLLLERGHEQSSILEIAIAIDSVRLVKYLIDDWEVNILEVHCDEEPPDTYVHFAAEIGSLRVFKYFIEEKKVSVNLKNKLGQPLAFAAARKAEMDIIRYIVDECRGDLTVTDQLHRNIFSQSAEMNDLIVPKYLLDEKKLGIDINNGYILQDAITNAEKGSDRLNEFLKYFVEVKRMDINGNKDATPLHRAASLGMLDVVKYLVSHGADTRRKDWMGRIAQQVTDDAGVLNFLAGCMRTRRSVSRTLLSLPSQPDPEISAHTSLIESDHPSSVTKCTPTGYTNNFRDFLYLAIASFWSDRGQRVDNRHVGTSSREGILSGRIDPVAMRAIHDRW